MGGRMQNSNGTLYREKAKVWPWITLAVLCLMFLAIWTYGNARQLAISEAVEKARAVPLGASMHDVYLRFGPPTPSLYETLPSPPPEICSPYEITSFKSIWFFFTEEGLLKRIEYHNGATTTVLKSASQSLGNP